MIFCLGKMALIRAAVVFLLCTEVSISFPVYYNGFPPTFYILKVYYKPSPSIPDPPKPQKTNNPTITQRPTESTNNPTITPRPPSAESTNPTITPRPPSAESTTNPTITQRPTESTTNPTITPRPPSAESTTNPTITPRGPRPKESGKCDHQPAAAPIFVFPSRSGKETQVFHVPSISGGHAGSNHSGHSVFVFPEEDQDAVGGGGGGKTQGQSEVPFYVYPNEVANAMGITRGDEETSGPRGDTFAGVNGHESIPPSMVILPGVLVRVPEGGE